MFLSNEHLMDYSASEALPRVNVWVVFRPTFRHEAERWRDLMGETECQCSALSECSGPMAPLRALSQADLIAESLARAKNQTFLQRVFISSTKKKEVWGLDLNIAV